MFFPKLLLINFNKDLRRNGWVNMYLELVLCLDQGICVMKAFRLCFFDTCFGSFVATNDPRDGKKFLRVLGKVIPS